MPFKHNASRRHRIGKMKFKVTNWPEYEAGLRRRGILTLWVTLEALSSWQAPKRTTRGGQPRYSDLAIETALTLGLVFGLRLRQTEGLVTSVLKLMGLNLAVPDHTTLSRRASKPRLSNKRHDSRDRIPEKCPSMPSSTAQGCKSTVQASGWRKIMVSNPAATGESCTWHWTPTAATSSRMS